MISSKNPISIGQKGLKLQLIKEIQISPKWLYKVKIRGILNARTSNVV